MFKATMFGAPNISAAFLAGSLYTSEKVEARLRHFAFMGLTKVKANASGRPGPRRVTGDYVRSMTAQPKKDRGITVWFIGTNKVQGPRLEFGFVGADSLGRVYDQPPYPHFQPMIDWLRPQFDAGFQALVNDMVLVVQQHGGP